MGRKEKEGRVGGRGKGKGGEGRGCGGARKVVCPGARAGSRRACLCRHAVSVRPFVCLSVCLSRSWIMSKRIKIYSKFFHCRVATPFYFFRAKRHSNIPTGTPLTGASNAGRIGRNRDSEPISDLTACVNAATGKCCQRGRR